MAYLARYAGKVCTHHMILKDVWGPGYGAESNYVRVYTHRLRKKLHDDEGRSCAPFPASGTSWWPTPRPTDRCSRRGVGSARTIVGASGAVAA